MAHNMNEKRARAKEDGTDTVSLFERLSSESERHDFLEHRARHTGFKEFEALAGYILGDACTQDLKALLQGVFDYPLPRQFQLRKSHSDQRRTVYAYPERQTNMMKYVNWGMLEYDDVFSDSLYSFRKAKGTADVFRKIKQMDFARGLYMAKADVHDYGHSVRPVFLKPMLADIIGPRDPQLFSYLIYLLDRGAYLRDGQVVCGDMGGLPGIPMGCFFNNVYLTELDAEMCKQTVLYCRYADDIAAFTTTCAEAERAIDTIRTYTAKLGLSLNEDKTLIIAPGEPIELLGIKISDGNLDVSDHTLAKAKGKLTHFADKLIRSEQRKRLDRKVAAAMMVRRIDHYFFRAGNEEHELSWRDFFFRVITRPESLHGLDLTCQDLIRRVATGKRGDARYRFRYEDMRALGYRPLVHEYYEYLEARSKR